MSRAKGWRRLRKRKNREHAKLIQGKIPKKKNKTPFLVPEVQAIIKAVLHTAQGRGRVPCFEARWPGTPGVMADMVAATLPQLSVEDRQQATAGGGDGGGVRF